MNAVLHPTQKKQHTDPLHADTPCISGMSDAELDAHIADCSRQMLAADALYQAHGCFNDKAARDAAAAAQTLALLARIARRSPEQIAAIERRLGLTPPESPMP